MLVFFVLEPSLNNNVRLCLLLNSLLEICTIKGKCVCETLFLPTQYGECHMQRYSLAMNASIV